MCVFDVFKKIYSTEDTTHTGGGRILVPGPSGTNFLPRLYQDFIMRRKERSI